VLPILYLRGLSTGDFRPALEGLLGADAAGLSPTNITRLTASWEKEYTAFRRRDLAGREYVYVWVDGVHFNIRLEDDRLCTLVMIGARPNGEKELLAVEDGYRESAESWKTLLRDLKRRGMAAPMVAAEFISDKLEVRSLSEHTGKAGPLAEPGPRFDFNRADYFAAFTLRVRTAF
jgi:transposase-like protein